MQGKEYLFKRAVEDDTETPRECQIQAVYLASQGSEIPDDIRDAVLASAERRREEIANAMDLINGFAGIKNEQLIRDNFLELAAQIADSHGIKGPQAFRRRLDHLRNYVFGLALTELGGPTE